MRINIYLPDDKRELYEYVKEELEKEGRSVSQLFLEALQTYAEKSSKKIELRKKVVEYIVNLFRDVYPEVHLTKSKIGRKRPDFIVEVDEGWISQIAVVVVKRIPITKAEIKNNKELLRNSIFSHESAIEDFLPALIKNKIPLFIIFYAGEDGTILKIDVIDILGFSKKEVFPLEESEDKVIETLKKAIKKAVERKRKMDYGNFEEQEI